MPPDLVNDEAEGTAKRGKGCWYCPYETPIARLSHSRVCFTCLTRMFPGWQDGQVSGWLVRQVEKGVAWTAGADVRAEQDEESLKKWLEA